MKIFAALSLLIVLPSSLVAAVPHPERRDPCGNINNASNLRRLYHPTIKDHYYSTSILAEVQWYYGYGYVIQTDNAALVFTSATEASSLVPLYRLYQTATQTNLYTASASYRQTLLTSAQPPFVDGTFGTFGTGQPELAGYVYPDGSCPGTVPLLWATSSLFTDNFYTIDTAEYNSFVANGYTPMGPVAWVYPVPSNRITTSFQ